ncbi:DnaJ family domain-containing protein [Desulfonauticus submarinus]|uniref:DnaJ homologue subfamily C member 28 conserved domain-containing protein n=1 Tax=Desulfonauticus submarinus TaxID=206665 RepID=A0A1H0BWN5_9BACT|nr:DnaJ family domain-containing protein [Desulfonauticus submarinus]SDN49976.1 protein of unknown function [Desulfonauticus submarinus]
MDILAQIAEEKIKEAMKKGVFDDIQGKGQPLDLDDEPNVPEDLKIAYKILKNSGYLPPEIEQGREVQNTLELISGLEEGEEKYRQLQKLNLLVMKMNLARKRPVYLEYNQIYFEKVVSRVQVNKNRQGERRK